MSDTRDEIDDLTDEWTADPSPTCSLPAHLGMTERQYGEFAEDGTLPPGYVPPVRRGSRATLEGEDISRAIGDPTWPMAALILICLGGGCILAVSLHLVSLWSNP